MIFRNNPKKITLNITSVFSLMLILSVLLTFIMFFLQINESTAIFTCIKNSMYFIFILNFLPIILVMFLIFFICNNFSISVGIVYFLVIVMSAINRFKIIFRYNPFFPLDILLGGEVLGISKSFSPKLVFAVVTLIIVLIAIIVVSCIFIKNEKINFNKRIYYIIINAVVIVICNKELMSQEEINDTLYVNGNIYNQIDQFNSKGFLYSFIYNFNNSKIIQPKNYDKQKIDTIIKNYKSTPSNNINQKKPHVILILSEGFSDIALSEAFDFEGYTDPLKNYKKIKEESIQGHIVAPNFGGGTADTEFDIFTGINTRDFREIPYSYMAVTKEMKSIVSIFNELGYNTQAIHPGYPWFYNRQNVFNYLGFNDFTSINQFNQDDLKGMYITEKATISAIINKFEQNKNFNTPLFVFCATIQNHGPYQDKYLVKTNFNSNIELSEQDTNALSNYFEGLADSDRELNRLVEYMRKSNEPVVIVYYGDHLPLINVQALNSILPKSNYGEDFDNTLLYQTPYIIWANDEAKKITKPQNNIAINSTISSFYMAGVILDYLKFGDIDPFFNFINDLQSQYPIILEGQYLDNNYNAYDLNITNDKIDTYKMWEYYNIYGK